MRHQSKAPTLGGVQAWVNWSVSVLFVVLVFTLQTGYAITNVSVAKDLSLSMAQVGFIGTIYTFVFAITQLVSGSILEILSNVVYGIRQRSCLFQYRQQILLL